MEFSKYYPLVSIVIPYFNHSSYIKECVESIYAQDYTNFELFVIDDGSTDNSYSSLIKLQKKYGFYLERNENQGISNTLNRGFKDLANGDFVTFCASDDFYLPKKISKQVDFLLNNDDCAMVYGKAIVVDTQSKRIDKLTISSNKYLKGGYIFEDIILQKFHPPVNYMIRADILKEIGYYRKNIWAEDFDMNLRLSLKYPIGFINDFLIGYRSDESINKNLNFKTIYSHLDSIDQFKDHSIYKLALKDWHYRCFLWYSPYIKGKKIAFKGMIANLDRCFEKEFIIFLLVLIRKWK